MGLSSKKNNAPFGIATKRFAKVGFHPELDPTGAMKKEITKTGPGSYNPQRIVCPGKQGNSWKVKIDTEDFSKFLGYRNANYLYERNFRKSLGGPGATDVNENLYKKCCFSVVPNTGFGTGDRFRSYGVSFAPPPVTYQKETSTMVRNQFSNVMPFEWDGFVDRFKSRDPSYILPPNRYDIKDGKAVEDIVNRYVSERGPYDLFTGPRDGSTIKNHFAPPKRDSPEYGYIKPGDMDFLLNNPSKKNYGKFLKATRYPKKPTIRSMLNDLSLCYRNPSDPGPGHYYVENYKGMKIHSKSLHPFDSSKVYARPPVEWKIFPGPGRYNAKSPKCMKLRRPSCVFLSTTSRDLYTIINYAAF